MTKPRITLSRDWQKKSLAEATIKAPSCALDKSCELCAGKGYVLGTEGAYTSADLCTCIKSCTACFGKARMVEGNDSKPCRLPPPNVIVNLINAALIPARYADASLERFQNFSGNGREFLQRMLKWKTRFTPRKSMGLLVTGPVGVGKTYVLAALAKEFAERGHSVRFTDFFQLLGELRAGFSEGKADTSQLMPLIGVDVLIIDELGKGRNKDFDKTVLDQLVCGRYNQSKTIIASTNYLLESRSSAHAYNIDLERDTGAGLSEFAPDSFGSLESRVGQRIFSRLREMTNFMELKGDDYRRQDRLR